jgi:PAS domain S-box-containing protein
MLNPWPFEHDIYFDTRSVLLSLGGLFFGLIPTTIAVVIAGAFRLYQGGSGGLVGTIVIVVTSSVGVAWKYWKDKQGNPHNWIQLYMFGVVVHLAMLSCMFIFPAELRNTILKNTAFPILLIYPILSMIIGLILKRQEDRRATDKALLYSSSLTTAALESTPDGILIVDLERKIARWNQKFVDLWHVPEALLKPPFEDTPVLMHVFEQMVNPKEFLIRVNELYKHPEESSADTLYLADGRIFDRYSQPQKVGNEIVGRFWSFRDITEQKQTEALVSASNKLLQAIINTAPIRVFWKNTALQYLGCNQAFATDAGLLSPDDILGKDDNQLVWKEQAELYNIDDRRVIESGNPVLFYEEPQTTPNGSLIWLRTSKVPLRNELQEIIGVLGIYEDITERRITEQKLLQEKEFSSEVLNCLPGLFYIIGTDNRFLRWNLNFETVSEYTSEEFSLISPLDLFQGKDKNLINERIQEVFVKGVSSAEADLVTKSGNHIAYHFTGRTIQIEGATYLIGMGIDISDRKRAEEERMKLEQQLLHTQKLESLGVLAGGIAHDFNNILTSIVGNADLALMKMPPESPSMDNLRRIESAAAKAADLAKQMLAYSGKGKFAIKNLDINRLLEEMLHMLEVSITKKAVMRLNLTPNLPSVEADATQIRQILMNLVINASEAIGDKSGVIAVTTGCMDCERNYLKDVWLDENIKAGLYVYLEIADTGCGMDKETLSKIFDPFFTTKFTGRGLGMAAVLGIVRGHNGAIKVYSEPGKGSTFKILLPASGKPVEIFNPDINTDDWRGNGTVLLVDDEETVRGIGKEMLHELGFTTIIANDGMEAVEIFKQTPDVAFVILDLTMPRLDGEQCFRELRQLKPDVKIIMSSGFSEYEVTQKFAGKGFVGFIQKPYKLSVLKETIQKIQMT